MSCLLDLYSPFNSASLASIFWPHWHIGIQFKSRGLVCIVRLGEMGVD